MAEQKFALLFPGQGTQYRGMGRDIYSDSDTAKNVYEKARNILGFPKRAILLSRIFQRLELNRTDYAQIAIFVTNHALYKTLADYLPLDDSFATAGHSLGEYNALVASGAVSFEDAFQLVQKRGQYMHQVSRNINSGLVALIGKDEASLNAQLNELNPKGIYQALINSPTEIIIGGSKYDLDVSKKELEQRGIKAIDVKVAGPFHTPYMAPAADLLKEHIDSTQFYLAHIPIVFNSSARFRIDPTDIKEELYVQISSTVKWLESIRRMIGQGVRRYIVIGADKKESIKNMVNKTDPSVEVFTVKDKQSLDNVVKKLSKQDD